MSETIGEWIEEKARLYEGAPFKPAHYARIGFHMLGEANEIIACTTMGHTYSERTCAQNYPKNPESHCRSCKWREKWEKQLAKV